jgi:hypothetical protein
MPEPEFDDIPLSQTTEFGSFEEGEIQSASIPSVEVEQGSTPVTEPDYSQITATMGPVDWQTDLRMEIQDAGRRTNETMGGLLITGIDRGINAADSIRTTLEAYGDDPSLIWGDVKDIAGSVATRLDDNFNEILFEWSYGSLGDREQYQASTARDIQAFENTVQSGIDKVQRIGDAIDREDYRAVGGELFDPAVAGLMVLGTRGKGFPGPDGNTSPIPGLDRPFRTVDSAKIEDSVLQRFQSSEFLGKADDFCIDCSQLADDLIQNSTRGSLLRITPASSNQVIIPETVNGKIIGTEFDNHFIFTDGKAVFDPRLSIDPIPKGDFSRLIRHLNPDGVVFEREIIKPSTGVQFKPTKF